MRKFGFKFFSTNFQASPKTITEAVEYIASKPDMFMEISIISSTTEAEQEEKSAKQSKPKRNIRTSEKINGKNIRINENEM